MWRSLGNAGAQVKKGETGDLLLRTSHFFLRPTLLPSQRRAACADQGGGEASSAVSST